MKKRIYIHGLTSAPILALVALTDSRVTQYTAAKLELHLIHGSAACLRSFHRKIRWYWRKKEWYKKTVVKEANPLCWSGWYITWYWNIMKKDMNKKPCAVQGIPSWRMLSMPLYVIISILCSLWKTIFQLLQFVSITITRMIPVKSTLC